MIFGGSVRGSSALMAKEKNIATKNRMKAQRNSVRIKENCLTSTSNRAIMGNVMIINPNLS